MSAVVYRDAGLADTEALAAFSAATFIETFGHLYPPADLASFLESDHTPALYAEQIADGHARVCLALIDDEIVGYTKAGEVKIDVADAARGVELHRLYVRTDMKGAGIAQRLMDDVLGWSRASGAAALYLSVWENNVRAQRFYKRYGFEHVGEHDFMVGQTRDRDFIWRLQL